MLSRMIASAMLVVLSLAPSFAWMNSWTIGANHLFIGDYLVNQNKSCGSGMVLPSNYVSVSLSTIDAKLLKMARADDGHMGFHREIIPFGCLAPTSASDTQNYATIDAVLEKYVTYNLYLELTLGIPVPAWASPRETNNGSCWMPSSSSDWTIARNNLIAAFGNYLIHFKNKGSRESNWMAGRLIVSMFNELDNYYDVGTCNNTLGTPARNADLTNGLGWELATYSIPNLMYTTASWAGLYSGSYSNGCNADSYLHKFTCYASDTYANSNYGSPNVHVYASGCANNPQGSCQGSATAANAAANIATIISGISAVVPANWANKIVLGETGWLKYPSGCSPWQIISLPEGGGNPQWDNVFVNVASDNMSQYLSYEAFWFDWDEGSAECNSMGLFTSNWTATAGYNNLAQYLRTH